MSATEGQISVNTNLHKQDLQNLDISHLTALSPEVISRQATINIGTIGHVAHGKSTVVKAISGVQTVRFKNELERNITIKLERLSYEKMLKIAKNPQLLRNYIERQEEQIRNKRKKSMSPTSFSMPLILESLRRNTNDNFLRISCSPSSGYESAFDTLCSSPTSFTQFSLSGNKKKRRHSTFLSTTSFDRNTEPIKKKVNTSLFAATSSKRVEYVVEQVLSIEAVQSRPLFFVKWKNYPESQNTWEPISNLIDCHLFQIFIKEQYENYAHAIASVRQCIKMEILEKGLTLDIKNTAKIIKDVESFNSLEEMADLILLAQFRLSGSRSKTQPTQIRNRIIHSVLLRPYMKLRKQQLYDLSIWQEKVNIAESQTQIEVENQADFDIPDRNFTYIKESFPGKGVHIDGDPPIGCKCDDECSYRSMCCGKMADDTFAYDKTGRLRIKPGGAIYECNSLCACGPECTNRTIQKGRRNSLCIFKTLSGCGWGVRTQKPIRRGEFVCEYVGEIITADEANIRGKQYDAIGRTYLFDLDYNTSPSAESTYTVDAAMYGNVSHFINHSCDPNLAVFPFWINCLDINLPRLAFFSLRLIKAGEELTFDYIRDLDAESTYTNLSDAEKVACRCGAEKCRKVLF